MLDVGLAAQMRDTTSFWRSAMRARELTHCNISAGARARETRQRRGSPYLSDFVGSTPSIDGLADISRLRPDAGACIIVPAFVLLQMLIAADSKFVMVGCFLGSDKVLVWCR